MKDTYMEVRVELRLHLLRDVLGREQQVELRVGSERHDNK